MKSFLRQPKSKVWQIKLDEGGIITALAWYVASATFYAVFNIITLVLK